MDIIFGKIGHNTAERISIGFNRPYEKRGEPSCFNTSEPPRQHITSLFDQYKAMLTPSLNCNVAVILFGGGFKSLLNDAMLGNNCKSLTVM